MAATAPRRPRATAPGLLLLLGAAAGSSHFLDKTQLTKKGDAHLKQEGIIRLHNSVALSEPMKISSIPDVPQTPHQILGKENSTVPVYVSLNKGLALKCLTEKLLKQGINDPEYQWVGPTGLITKDSGRLVLTADYLEFYNVQASDTGSYTCKVTYAHNGKHEMTQLHFMIYVYHKPGTSLHLASEFKTGSCETSAVVSFEKRLLEDLKRLTHDLQCGIWQWNVQCHAATDSKAMLTHKLTLHFVVFPFALAFTEPCESPDCKNSSNCVKKAYTQIQQHLRVRKSHEQQTHYIPGSLTASMIDHCKPGFGKNISKDVCPGCCILQNCVECEQALMESSCYDSSNRRTLTLPNESWRKSSTSYKNFIAVVTCPPGRFSTEYKTVCTLCPPGSYNEKYGQTACKSCPKQHSTNRKGAKRASDCYRTLQIWIVYLMIPTGIIFILLASWLITQPVCRRRLAARYVEAEPELKAKVKAFAYIATDAEIQAQRRKLRSPAKNDRRHFSKHKGKYFHEESRRLLSNITATEASTPCSSDRSLNYTWRNEAESSFEEGASQTTMGE